MRTPHWLGFFLASVLVGCGQPASTSDPDPNSTADAGSPTGSSSAMTGNASSSTGGVPSSEMGGSSSSAVGSSSTSSGGVEPGACPEPSGTPPTLGELASRFATEIHPLMTRPTGGCIACHAAGAGRLMSMGPTGEDTFHRLRAGGYLRNVPGGILDRVARDTMPPGGPAWATEEKSLLSAFVCAVEGFENASQLPVDESFPEELRAPYTGPAATEYDNTFLTYEQLRGRILTQFGDATLAQGIDPLRANIALFGGVDFVNTFVAARQATPEYFLGLDIVGEDVCARAARDHTGPFDGIDTSAATLDEPAPTTTTLQAESMMQETGGSGITFNSSVQGGTTYINLFVSAALTGPITVPTAGTYRFTLRAQGDEAGPELPNARISVDGQAIADIPIPEPPGFTEYTVEGTIPTGGMHTLTVAFTNDYYDAADPDPGRRDRNLLVDRIRVEGPLPGTSPGAPNGAALTKDRLALLFERILLRQPVRGTASDEIEPLYTLLRTLEDFDGNREAAWSNTCAALLKHPDFLFTRPPTFDTAPAAERPRLLFIKTALDLLNRPPTPEEFTRLAMGTPVEVMVQEWSETEAFKNAYLHRLRLLLESDGTAEADEPARLWMWMFLNDRPISDLLTGDYRVDANLQQRDRPAHHGPTGVLTMKGYIKHKPGLPHYNYPARVLSDFLGYIFEVPPEIVDMRAGTTAVSTVDPTSVCFSCHQLLTPLAHQRLRWDDQGNYRTMLEDGSPIDDSDRNMVEIYPYKGSGMASFAAQAVRKERFIRRMANAQFEMFFGRPMRHETDERALYQALWDAAQQGRGTFRQMLLTILASEPYVNPVGSRATGSAP